MVTKIDTSTPRKKVVATYIIETGNNVSFSVKLFENVDGLREFDIQLSANAKDDYSEVYTHPFYNNFVLPWVYGEKHIDSATVNKEDNVVRLFK